MDTFTSKIFDLDEIDLHDDVELELVRHFTQHCSSIKDKSEIELHNYLQEKVSQSKKDYVETVSALLYGILTEPEHAQSHFHSLSLVNRDHFATVIVKLQYFASSIKFQSLKSRAKDQILWLSSELTTLNVQNIDSVYIALLRQIRCGDLSQQNTSFCYQMLKLCDAHKQWLHIYPKVLATAVFTYLRIIADHRSTQLASLQQRETKFVISLMREKWMICCLIGRDLVRLLQDVSSIPDFAELWQDILNEPQKLSSSFKGIAALLQTPTPREYLRSRLSPDMEHKLLFILQNLRINHYQRNLGWFLQRFIGTSESVYVDVIRFIVAGWYPNNQILQSDIVPRYVVIGSMLRGIKNPVVAANVKAALVFDWLFFTANDNIMFIEPSMLLMERSAERYPYITAIIMEFLKHAVEDYFPPLRDYMANCVSCGMRVMLEKGVIRSLSPIYNCPSIDDATRGVVCALFGDFVARESISSSNPTESPHPPAPVPIPVESHQSAFLGVNDGNSQSEISRSQGASNAVDDPESGLLEGTRSVNNHDSQILNDDDDVDRYLYGEYVPDTQESGREIKRTNMNEMVLENTTALNDSMNLVKGDDRRRDIETSVAEAPMPARTTVSTQWYLVFGDSLSTFKEACAAFLADTSRTHYLAMRNAKESLSEIIKVYLRMSITGHTLAAVIDSEILEVISRLSVHTLSIEARKSTESVINDRNEDIFDILMTYLWSAIIDDAANDCKKTVDLIGQVAQRSKGNNAHLVGMRWWHFFARQGNIDNNSSTQADWMPAAVKAYKKYAMLAYGVSETQITDALSDDIQLLAEQNFEAFFAIIPLLYRYAPSYTAGNMKLLSLLASIAIPKEIERMTTLIQSGTMQLFGDTINIQFLVESIHLDPYETVFLWQMLSTEFAGRQELIEKLFQSPEIVTFFHFNGK
ncbi:protein-domain-containing protein [Dichotomocladium elegans]|nr:protein-domain-containing protein [Dichotomocladium elegans]